MSGFRRHLMAKLAQQEYIEGYAVQVGGVYPATIAVVINNILTYVSVDSSTGYWRWSGELTTLKMFMSDRDNSHYVKVHYPNQSLALYQFARRSQSLVSIDCSGVEANNLYFAFGLNAPDYNDGYRSALQSLKLPIIRNTTLSVLNCCYNTRVLTDVEAIFIESSITFAYSPLTLQSAINVLNALQDVTSYGGATLTFSSTTSALVQADTTAMNLVAQTQANGWTITFN